MKNLNRILLAAVFAFGCSSVFAQSLAQDLATRLRCLR